MPLSLPPEQRRLRAQIAAETSWANTENRSARTSKARAALDQKFLDQAGGDPVRAEHLRRAYYLKLAYRSAQARQARKATTDPKAG
jgi:hypothetical protein